MTAGAALLAEATSLAERAPERAVSGNVRCGTAGWTDPSLIKSGLFYPKGKSSPKARLEHYARHFSLVEVDATYYSILPPETSSRWVTFTPADFEFDVKAHPVFTGHPIDVLRLPPDLRDALGQGEDGPRRVYPDDLPGEIARELEARFLAFLAPLREAGRLGCVLLQFPPWYEATRGNAKRIEEAHARLAGVPIAVEFRNPSWLAEERGERVFALLADLGASYVAVDEPDVAQGGVPPVTRVTNPKLSIVRFHGQNARGWHRGASVAERFDYLYSAEELAGWVAPVRELAGGSEKVHAVFNNCVRNHAVLNAKGLAALLASAAAPGLPKNP